LTKEKLCVSELVENMTIPATKNSFSRSAYHHIDVGAFQNTNYGGYDYPTGDFVNRDYAPSMNNGTSHISFGLEPDSNCFADLSSK